MTISWRTFARRVGIAWRFVRNRSHEDDAYHLRRAASDADGYYPLEGIRRDDVFAQLIERYGDDPRLLAWSRRACECVAGKWSGGDDIVNAAEEWAHDLIVEYAGSEDVQLSDAWAL